MLVSLKNLEGFALTATDGEAGRVYSFLFDDRHWKIRYLVAETGGWMSGRRVLLLPEHLGKPDYNKKAFPVKLTRQEVEARPDIDTDRPVSEQQENIWSIAGGWNPYDARFGAPPVPEDAEMAVLVGMARERFGEAKRGNPNLRSSDAVIDYRVHARDGDIGDIDDLIADDDGWTVRYVTVDTGTWLPGRKVIVSPDWVLGIDWDMETVHLDLTKDEIRRSPEYDPKEVIGRSYEEMLYKHYGRPDYWSDRWAA